MLGRNLWNRTDSARIRPHLHAALQGACRGYSRAIVGYAIKWLKDIIRGFNATGMIRGITSNVAVCPKRAMLPEVECLK